METGPEEGDQTSSSVFAGKVVEGSGVLVG